MTQLNSLYSPEILGRYSNFRVLAVEWHLGLMNSQNCGKEPTFFCSM